MESTRSVPIWLAGAAIGASIGAFWWSAYVPSAHSFGLLVVAHALAGLALAVGVGIAVPRWRENGSVACGLLGGFVLGPLLVVMPYARGWLAGLEGLVLIAAAMGLGALLGLEVGRRPLFGAIATAAAIATTALWNTTLLEARERSVEMAARDVVADFPERPVAVIGIDGADWRVIRPMLERDALPHLADLISRGRHGVLRSIEPTLSPVVWTTIFSGQPAEVHGLRDWSTSDNRNRRVPMLWDLFGAHDRRSLVINVPGSWPPAPVAQGRILAGFPIPGIVSGSRGQLTGTIASNVPDAGPVATTFARPIANGLFAFGFPIAAPHLRPRIRGVSHALIDAATQDRMIPVANDDFAGHLQVGSGRVELISDRLAEPVALPLDAWSDWMHLRLSEGHAYVQARVIEASPERLRIYFTPAFQDPVAPRYPFAYDIGPSLFERLDAPYVVEGVGWRAHRDPRVAALLPEALAQVERTHADAALALLAERTPDLFVYASTLTDRIQHPFWPDHAPESYPDEVESHPGLDGRDPVEDAYATADTLLGELLAALPEDVLVFVVSDHGAAATDRGEGGHRVEGIWIAAGPDVEAADEPLELSILDLVPTLLHCVGAPAAEDMPGRVAIEICPRRGEATRIASYRAEPGAKAAEKARDPHTIDATREEQLRSLGYLE